MIFSGKEHWLGLDTLYNLTNSDILMELSVTMESFNGSRATAIYDEFSLEDQVGPIFN